MTDTERELHQTIKRATPGSRKIRREAYKSALEMSKFIGPASRGVKLGVLRMLYGLSFNLTLPEDKK